MKAGKVKRYRMDAIIQSYVVSTMVIKKRLDPKQVCILAIACIACKLEASATAPKTSSIVTANARQDLAMHGDSQPHAAALRNQDQQLTLSFCRVSALIQGPIG